MLERRQRPHAVIIVLLLLGHSLLHYLILFPSIGEALENAPYFKLHVLHEAEYVALIAYASLIFRLRGGLLALSAFILTSIPFLVSSQINSAEYISYGFPTFWDGVREFFLLLCVGTLIVVLNELWGRER